MDMPPASVLLSIVRRAPLLSVRAPLPAAPRPTVSPAPTVGELSVRKPLRAMVPLSTVTDPVASCPTTKLVEATRPWSSTFSDPFEPALRPTPM